jgi:para-nitrobenzyl esterase
MKKRTLFLLIFSTVFSSVMAQSSMDCQSGRFDTEVFPSVTNHNNLLYGSNTSYNGTITQLYLDEYEPAGDTMAARPLIIWAHGGSFVTGSRIDPDIVSLSNHFAKRGYVCASIEYRMGIPFPPSQAGATQAVYRAVQDMKAAIRYFRKDAATTNLYHIDPSRIYVGGSSAGAFMALHLAYLDEVAELPSSIDTVALGNLEGNSGNPGYSSDVSAVVNLCGAIGNKTWLHSNDEPLCSMHGTNDNTVPYSTATIYLYGVYPLMVVDGSYAINQYADQIGLQNVMYTYFGSDHVPYLASTAYMDTTVRFVSNFLYGQLGCTPADPTPYPNTFIATGLNGQIASTALEVFPNPTHEYCMIRHNEVINTVRLKDLAGRLIMEKTVGEKETLLTVAAVATGIYLLEITGEHGIRTQKLVIK